MVFIAGNNRSLCKLAGQCLTLWKKCCFPVQIFTQMFKNVGIKSRNKYRCDKNTIYIFLKQIFESTKLPFSGKIILLKNRTTQKNTFFKQNSDSINSTILHLIQQNFRKNSGEVFNENF